MDSSGKTKVDHDFSGLHRVESLEPEQIAFSPEAQKIPEIQKIMREQASFLGYAQGVQVFYNQSNNMYFAEGSNISGFEADQSESSIPVFCVAFNDGTTRSYALDSASKTLRFTYTYSTNEKIIRKLRKAVGVALFSLGAAMYAQIYGLPGTDSHNPPAIVRAIQQAVSASGTIKVEPLESEPLEPSENGRTP